MIENIISGIIGGIVVFLIQLIFEHLKSRKEKENKNKVGNPTLLILDKDFLYKYAPYKYSIEKIISEFGQPFKRYKETFDEHEVEISQYAFQNAKVLFSKSDDTDDTTEITSITLFWTEDKDNLISCYLSYEDEQDGEMGKAFINDTIVEATINFENFSTPRSMTCVIQAKYFYQDIKYLTFSYEVEGNYDSVEEARGQKIKQVCVSQLQDVTPMISYYDTFFI